MSWRVGRLVKRKTQGEPRGELVLFGQHGVIRAQEIALLQPDGVCFGSKGFIEEDCLVQLIATELDPGSQAGDAAFCQGDFDLELAD